MNIEVVLVANGETADITSVSTTIALETTDPSWPATLVDAITARAHAAAEQLGAQLGGTAACRDSITTTHSFVPLASVVPTT